MPIKPYTFCERYKGWLNKRDFCMRQEHKAGEKLFVDYGDGLYIVNENTGEMIQTQLFVAVWGASNYTYAEASLSQELPNWIGAHVRAFEYFGCAPHVLVPDNLKSGVASTCWYEPEINRTYGDLALLGRPIFCWRNVTEEGVNSQRMEGERNEERKTSQVLPTGYRVQ